MIKPLISKLRSVTETNAVESKEKLIVTIRTPTQIIKAKYLKQPDGK